MRLLDGAGPAARPARIHITGVPGAGKSTLARQLGELLHLPVFHLDDVARDAATGRRRSVIERRQRAQEIASQPSWVTESVHTGWTDPLFERADLVIWLDHVRGKRAALRMTRRFLLQARREFRARGGWRSALRLRDYARHIRDLIRSVHEVTSFESKSQQGRDVDAGSRAATIAQVRPHAAKLVHCRSAADVEAVLLRLHGAAPPTHDP